MSSLQKRPQDETRTLLQYQELACFNQTCAKRGTADAPLKGCSRCKRVKYCSASCQDTDYPVHKAFCKVFSTIRNASPPSYPLEYLSLDDDDDDESSAPPIGPDEQNILLAPLLHEMKILVPKMGRSMGRIANYLLFLEPRCLWCYRTKAHLAAEKSDPASLISCSDCVGATYCSSDHQQKARATHKEHTDEDGVTQCIVFQRCLQDDDFTRFWSTLPDRPGDIIHWAPDRTLSASIPSLPDLPNSWDEFFTLNGCPYIERPPILRSMVTVSLSIPMTILDALHRFSIPPSSIGSKMVIHVLGATMEFEMDYGGASFEEIMHQLPWVKELVVVFVGPETQIMGSGSRDMETCPNCQSAGKKRTYVVHNSLYHDYASQSSYTTPNIAVAFNSGLHERPDLWEPTVKVLTSKGMPCVFTSYNIGEARDDTRHLEKMGAKIVWRGEKNKWSGGKAHFDYFTEGIFWFENAFSLGFRRSA